MLRIARDEAAVSADGLGDVVIPHWTYHDLRRTAASGMARLAQPIHVVEAVLNHKSGSIRGVAAIYNRYAYAEEKRKALDAWAHFVERLTTSSPASNVVALRSLNMADEWMDSGRGGATRRGCRRRQRR